MAKAIQTVRWPEPDPAAEAAAQRARLHNVAAEEAQALEKMMRLLGHLDDAGLLDIANALLAQGGQVMEIIVRQAEKPGTLGLLKSAIALTQGLSQADPQALRHLFAGLSAAGEAAGEASRGGRPSEVGGIFGLWRAMRDPDVAAGLGVMMAMLRGIGASVRRAGAEADGAGPREGARAREGARDTDGDGGRSRR